VDELTQIGGRFALHWASGVTEFEFAVAKKHEEGEKKLKVSSKGVVALAYSQKLGKHVRLQSSIELDTKKMSSKRIPEYGVGFRFDFK
jgi:hypothetical protein